MTLESHNKRILLTENFQVWSLLTEEDKEKPLKDFEGEDILSSGTMRQIKDNNDKAYNE